VALGASSQIVIKATFSTDPARLKVSAGQEATYLAKRPYSFHGADQSFVCQQVAGRLKEKEDEAAPLERQLIAAAGRAAAWDTSRAATLGRLGAERARLEAKSSAAGGLDPVKSKAEVCLPRSLRFPMHCTRTTCIFNSIRKITS
jgi:hypothetical protein